MNVSRETQPAGAASDLDFLVKCLEAGGIRLEQDRSLLLLQYLDLIEKWNKKINLVGPASRKERILLHLVDSLVGLPLLPKTAGALADLGSGAGLPGIPLKIASPEWKVCLIEARAKKADFLRYAVNCLRLDGSEVKNIRLDSKARFDLEGRFDAVTARALAPLEELINLAEPLLNPEGVFLAYKGPEGENEWIEASKKPTQLKPDKKINLTLPTTSYQRTILTFRKKMKGEEH